MGLRIVQLAVSPFVMNATLAIDEASGEAALFDPGDEIPALLAWAGREKAEITRLVATHCHLDHVGAAGEAAHQLGLPLKLHADDEPLLDALDRQAALFGLPPPPEPPAERRHLAAGDTLVLGESELRVLLCPGHSPGSLCFAGDGKVIVGDVLFQGSIGRTDLPGGDYGQLMDSIATHLLTLPDATEVFSGHGSPTTIGQERRTNPFVRGLG